MATPPLSVGFCPTSIPGTFVCEARDPHCAYPVGTVWFRLLAGETEIEVLGSYVPVLHRRKGIRTYMNAQLLAAYSQVDALVTEGGSHDGVAFMRSQGYKRQGSWWRLSRGEQKKPKKSA